ncbi:hypothetical protein OSB04_002409 [Centaurea solstitialis]|uniref:HAT C-terminal dimerisation domain-containing protein n=1 Tax=Centaurea solstitialis TaxID=347529 RepID=A0AA38TSV0_9ASTR|nr:hypothetical protein OSB04_002409 [Centaurea solstitialis]
MAAMAKDILAILASTVASEYSFSTGGRVLDTFRRSLTPTVVETLVCSHNWLRSKNVPLDIEEKLEELENFEADLKDLPLPQVFSSITIHLYPTTYLPSRRATTDYVLFNSIVFGLKMEYSQNTSQQPSSQPNHIVTQSESQPKKQKATETRSVVWEHLEKIFNDDRIIIKGMCLNCLGEYVAQSKRHGTTTLRNHIGACLKIHMLRKRNRQCLLFNLENLIVVVVL